MGWLSEFISTFVSFFPHLLKVRATHGAVKFVHGKKVVELKPGLHWYWPLVTEVLEIPTARTTYNFDTQVILTRDAKPLAVSAVLVYRVVDVVAALSQSYDVDDTVGDVGNSSITRVLSGKTLDEVLESQREGNLQDELTEMCSEELSEFGIEVEAAALTDFSTCMVIKTLGNAPAIVPVAAE